MRNSQSYSFVTGVVISLIASLLAIAFGVAGLCGMHPGSTPFFVSATLAVLCFLSTLCRQGMDRDGR